MLPSREFTNLRSRILSSLLIFGLLLCVLVALAVCVTTTPSTALLSLFLVLIITGLASWLAANAILGAVQQDLEQTNGTLTDFMFNIAHVLRTPANEVRWSVETLKNEEIGDVTEPQRELLDRLEHASVSLAMLATDLQDLMWILRGERLRMHPVPVDLLALIDESAGQWAVCARRRLIRLYWVKPKQKLPALVADPSRIRHVLNVLLENAIRYSPDQSKIALEVDVVPARISPKLQKKLGLPPHQADCVVVSVTDHGIGIPMREQASLFRPFFRASNARQVWVDGKGIGLALASSIVREHGGDLWIESRARLGTTARFSLPIVVS